MQINKKLEWIPIILFIITILISHFSGNDKAPFLVLFAGLFSIAVATVFVITGIKKNKKRYFIAAIPALLLLCIYYLSRYQLINPQNIIGFS